MTSIPQVSIILPTYNRPKDLRETLSNIRAHVGIPYEVVILDNSTQPTEVELLANEQCVFVGRNDGAAARNQGIQCAQAPYLLMLDDDSHPLPGAVEAGVRALSRSPQAVAGIMGNVERLDGTRESTLLPTTLLGCGVLFKTNALRSLPFVYPPGLCFYGEEYWVTLALYREGYRFESYDELRIVHRASNIGRDRENIFYHLGRNNAVVWQKFTPSVYLGQVLDDTTRRYEYIADREHVRLAFDRGLANALTPSWPVTPLTTERFQAFSLMDRFGVAAAKCGLSHGAVLCGTGKFPGLWARVLKTEGVRNVFLADFNPALIGRTFSGWDVLAPEPAVALGRLGYTFILGHASAADNARWNDLLAARGVSSENIVYITEVGRSLRTASVQQAA